MTGDLIAKLTARGEALDEGRRDGWKTFEQSFEPRVRYMLRSIAPDDAARLDFDDLLAKFDGEKDQVRESFERGFSVCESPIEKLLLPWLLMQQYNGFNHNPAVLLAGETQKYVPYTVAVIPQLEIGRYRADFALAASRKDGLIRFVVIECDGAEFHDGVENVVRDVNRDVTLLKSRRVLDVIRFSGKEIYRSARKCAAEAAEHVYKCWRTDNLKTASKFGGESP